MPGFFYGIPLSGELLMHLAPLLQNPPWKSEMMAIVPIQNKRMKPCEFYSSVSLL